MPEQKAILIIDDDSRNVFALDLVLRSRGYKVRSAGSARQGLDLLEPGHDIAIVLLDMMMPEMDGYQTLAHLRGHEAARNLPVIAVTAQAMPGDREKCLQAGATDYIAKPIDVDILTTLLKQYLI